MDDRPRASLGCGMIVCFFLFLRKFRGSGGNARVLIKQGIYKLSETKGSVYKNNSNLLCAPPQRWYERGTGTEGFTHTHAQNGPCARSSFLRVEFPQRKKFLWHHVFGWCAEEEKERRKEGTQPYILSYELSLSSWRALLFFCLFALVFAS